MRVDKSKLESEEVQPIIYIYICDFLNFCWFVIFTSSYGTSTCGPWVCPPELQIWFA